MNLFGKKRSKKVQLCLASGGARGYAHIGAIRELQRRGYTISSVTGCSMGSLVGGMFAAGKLEEFTQLMQTVDKAKMVAFSDVSLSLNHVMRGKRVIEKLKEIVPDVNIEDLPIPYCAIASDLEHGKQVEFRKGSLYDAIRASISIPLFFEAVRRDNMVLVDGGTINPLPVKQASQMPGDILVAVNVCSSFQTVGSHFFHEETADQDNGKSFFGSLISHIKHPEFDFNFATLAMRNISLMLKENADLNIQIYKPDILIDLTDTPYGVFDFDKVNEIASLGGERMRDALDAWEESQKSWFSRLFKS